MRPLQAVPKPVPATAALAAPAPASVWAFDPAHSSAEFAVKHLMIATVVGRFRTVEGTLHLDPARPEHARVEARVAAASVDTNLAPRDDHLRSADFFDAANHPHLTFTSTAVELLGDGEARVRGDLTIRGVTREVVFHATYDGAARDTDGRERLAFTAETTLNRRDFGLTWNQVLETGGVMVGDKVRVTLRVSAVRQAAA